MRIIANDLPKYTVEFNHPDDSSKIYEIFVDLEGMSEPWSDTEYEVYHKALIKEVWEKFNHYGYWHTMKITAEYTFEGKAHIATICDEVSWADIDNDAEYTDDAIDNALTDNLDVDSLLEIDEEY